MGSTIPLACPQKKLSKVEKPAAFKGTLTAKPSRRKFYLNFYKYLVILLNF